MMRNNDVLPDPDGPSSATSSPVATLRSTSSSAVKLPNFFTILRTSIVTDGSPLFEMAFENSLHNQRHEREEREQRCDRKRSHELIFIVQNFNQQRHGIRFATDVTRYHRDRAKLAHSASVT